MPLHFCEKPKKEQKIKPKGNYILNIYPSTNFLATYIC